MSLQGKFHKMIEVVPLGFSDVVGETGDEEATVESLCVGHMDGPTVYTCPTMFNGREQFIPRRIKNDAHDTPPLVLEANGNAICGIAMRKIRGPVEWIDDPPIRGGSFLVTTTLFG